MWLLKSRAIFKQKIALIRKITIFLGKTGKNGKRCVKNHRLEEEFLTTLLTKNVWKGNYVPKRVKKSTKREAPLSKQFLDRSKTVVWVNYYYVDWKK